MPVPVTKVLFTAAGGPEVVKIVDDVLADPKKGEVQVKVIYSGFGGSDMNMRNGTYPLQKSAPLTPGYCFVGRVSTNGPQAAKYKPGDLVCVLTKYDSEATYTNVPEKYAIPVPGGLDLQAACALILDWTTAYGMVYRAGKVQSGDKVFIHGLSGAVGQALLRLCKLEGAVIYGTASTSKHAQLKSQGVAEVFDYRSKGWIKSMLALGGANVAFDPLGFDSYDESFSILDKERSILVGYGGNLLLLNDSHEQKSALWANAKLVAKNLYFWDHRSTSFFWVDRDQKTFVPELSALFDLVCNGKVEVPIKKVFPLEDVPRIHRGWSMLEGVGSCLVKVE